MPHTGCSTKLSSLVCQAGRVMWVWVLLRSRRFTSAYSSWLSSESITAEICSASSGGAGSRGSIATALRMASVPLWLVATVSTTGTPSNSASLAASTREPRLRAMSLKFSDTTIGSPSVLSSNTMRKVIFRLVASATAIMASGWLPSSPSNTLRVTASSGLVTRRL